MRKCFDLAQITEIQRLYHNLMDGAVKVELFNGLIRRRGISGAEDDFEWCFPLQELLEGLESLETITNDCSTAM